MFKCWTLTFKWVHTPCSATFVHFFTDSTWNTLEPFAFFLQNAVSIVKKNKYILITGVCESCCCQAVDYSDRHRDNTALHSGAHNHATYLNHFFVKDVRVITSEAQCVVHKLALITSGGVIKYILNKCNQQQFGSNPYLTWAFPWDGGI